MPQVAVPTIRARAAELRAEVAAVRAEWLASLLGRALAVLAERDGTGHAPNFARVRLAPGTAPGEIVTIVPTRIEEGLLA
jgi:threonylcarbamoyladenosine tRNA methylthiotransferase MtaB